MRNTSFVLLAALSLSLAACGDDSPSADAATPTTDASIDGGGGDIDATPTVDSGSALAATEVDCAGVEPDQTIETQGFAWVPNEVSITVGQVVRFAPVKPHSIVSDDGLFTGGTAETVCVQFDAPGAYAFHCVPHTTSMTGTVTVTAQ